MSAPVYSALVHHPVRDRFGATVTTAVTNLDVHDIARSSRTYGLDGYFVVTPIAAQRQIVERILDHWREGSGQDRIPERGEALALVRPVPLLRDAVAAIEAAHGERPFVVVTSASPGSRAVIGFDTLRARIDAESRPVLLVFGTGHGLVDEVLDGADAMLAPVVGRGPYNHLSVRAAAAILFDRVLGPR